MRLENEPLHDALTWAAEFHNRIRDRLRHCSQTASDERLALLLDYLANHEDRLAKIIAAFEREGDLNSLNTWCVEYLNEKPIAEHKYSDKPLSELDQDQILDFVVFKHSQIIELFKNLLARAAIPSMTELLTNLVELEEHEIKSMVQGANRLSDA
tara:strand:+ start:591 stop:1055 length:465 start_codon:yes stop_codon:yes gene_type:complete